MDATCWTHVAQSTRSHKRGSGIDHELTDPGPPCFPPRKHFATASMGHAPLASVVHSHHQDEHVEQADEGTAGDLRDRRIATLLRASARPIPCERITYVSRSHASTLRVA